MERTKAKEIIDSGVLGKIISAHAMCWFYKPDDYFDIPWHRKKGAGPIIINAIHDIDSMRFLFGDLLSIQAVHANNARGYEVEDTAVALLTFESGIISTLTVSDAIVSPFNWEMTSAENPDYPVEVGFSCLVGGTKGCLSIPSLEVKTNASHYSWKEKIITKQNSIEKKSPLTAQIENFHKVVIDSAEPKVSGREGLETLKITLALKAASRTGNTIILQDFDPTIVD
ncbi:MAG: hypothetical protein COB24_14750 [Hyphomicrobiales bacterium]|nr:MAG: hypothetical protein COB24_14750 [Hyphomicrobiales bacterium]